MTLSCQMARYRFILTFSQPFTLPLYSGSLLRGAFGHALRRLSCITRQRSCDNCPILNGCYYPKLFEPKLLGVAPGQPEPPPLYILEPPPGPRQLDPGEEWHFDLVLLAPALSQLSLIILAFSQAAEHGFGSQHIPARVVRVDVQDEDHWLTICSSADPVIHVHNNQCPVPASPQVSELQLTFLTPTRLLRQGHPVGPEKLRASDLYGALLRRSSQLASILQLTAPEKMALQHLPLHNHDLRWMEWSRYSSRQRQSMQFGGLIGTLTLRDCPEALWPWLWLGQWWHVGKNASFGLGHYHIAT